MHKRRGHGNKGRTVVNHHHTPLERIRPENADPPELSKRDYMKGATADPRLVDGVRNLTRSQIRKIETGFLRQNTPRRYSGQSDPEIRLGSRLSDLRAAIKEINREEVGSFHIQLIMPEEMNNELAGRYNRNYYTQEIPYILQRDGYEGPSIQVTGRLTFSVPDFKKLGDELATAPGMYLLQSAWEEDKADIPGERGNPTGKMSIHFAYSESLEKLAQYIRQIEEGGLKLIELETYMLKPPKTP